MNKKKLLFYAPNVHNGGGLTLLLLMLKKIPNNIDVLFILDQRARDVLDFLGEHQVYWIKPKFLSRVWGELILFIKASSDELIFCFGGLPPIFYFGSSIIVFQQNRIYLDTSVLSNFPPRTAFRLFIERALFKLLRKKVNIYVVQTRSMLRLMKLWMPSANVRVVGFREKLINCRTIGQSGVLWDLIYISSAEGHKNHLNLLEAWKILALSGFFPSLALTIGNDNSELLKKIDSLKHAFNVRIENLGIIPHDQISEAYLNSRALIFPSKSESFGLPLMEASDLNLPIIASELDFVRDVCSPSQTFDPESPLSIARAVERFFNIKETLENPITPEEAWALICESSNLSERN